uniref:ABC transporter n=1 Tax=Aureoumbra lagunensis TaxID=44058 RepID=A0A7S3NQ86_9STRA
MNAFLFQLFVVIFGLSQNIKAKEEVRRLVTLRGGRDAASLPLRSLQKRFEMDTSAANNIDKRLVLECIATYAWRRATVGHKLLLCLSMMSLLLAKILTVSVPSFLQRGVDALSNENRNSAQKWFMVYCFGKLIVALTNEIRSTSFATACQRASRNLSADVFAKLVELDSDYHASHPAGGVAVAFSRGARGFSSLAFLVFFSIGPTIVELILSVLALTSRAKGPLLGIIAFGTFCAYAIFTAAIVEARIRFRKRLVQLETRRARALGDALANHDSIKSNANEPIEILDFDTILSDSERTAIISQRLGSLLNFGQALIFSFGLALSLRIALLRFFSSSIQTPKIQSHTFSLGDVVAVNALLLQLSQPMNFLGYTVSEIRQGFVDLSEMLDVLTEQDAATKSLALTNLLRSSTSTTNIPSLCTTIPQKQRPSDYSPLFRRPLWQKEDEATANPDRTALPPEIVFDQVWSSRDGGKTLALRGASFVAPAGKVTVLVGASGSGKSTALRLCALLDGIPCAGKIRAWGIDLGTGMQPRQLRKRLALIPQGTDLFDADLAYNLRYGDFSIPVNTLPNILKSLDLSTSIDQDVGERGTRLSGGERQRVLVARALLRDAPLCLADEPTSSADAHTEAKIIQSLLDATRPNRSTLIIVAHRLAAVTPAADHIVVFEQGQVVQQGSHRELIKQKRGTYAQLWKASNEQISSPSPTSAIGKGGGAKKDIN